MKELTKMAGLILLSSLLALVYVWRVIETAYFKEPLDPDRDVREAPLSMLIPTWALIAATIVFGLTTTRSAGVARLAAEALLSNAP